MGHWIHVGSMCCLLILVVVAEMMAHIRVTNHCCHWETRTVQGLSTADQTKTYFETSGKKFSTGAEIRATRDTVDDTHKEQIGPNIALMEQLLWCSNPLYPRFPGCFYLLISVFACHKIRSFMEILLSRCHRINNEHMLGTSFTRS